MTDTNWQEAWKAEHEANLRRHNISVKQAVENYNDAWTQTRHSWSDASDRAFYYLRKAELDALCDHQDVEKIDPAGEGNPKFTYTACRLCGRIRHDGG